MCNKSAEMQTGKGGGGVRTLHGSGHMLHMEFILKIFALHAHL